MSFKSALLLILVATIPLKQPDSTLLIDSHGVDAADGGDQMLTGGCRQDCGHDVAGG